MFIFIMGVAVVLTTLVMLEPRVEYTLNKDLILWYTNKEYNRKYIILWRNQ